MNNIDQTQQLRVEGQGNNNKGGNGNGGNGNDGNGNNGNGNGGNGNNNGNGGGNGNGTDKKVSLTVIVSGTPTVVEANPNQKLQVVAEKALEQTGNTARPLSDWTLKTREGQTLELTKTVADYGFVDGTQLVMSLEAGVGGSMQ